MGRALGHRVGGWALLALVAAWGVAACDSADSPDDGAGGDAAGGGAQGGAGTGAGEPQPFPGAQSCDELGASAASPEYPGIDASAFHDGAAPAGCELTAASVDEVSITLSDGANRASFEDGALHLNGVLCTLADGSPISLGETTHVSVVGAAGDDTFMLDLEGVDPAALVVTPAPTLTVDLGGGVNRLIVKGATTSDAVRATSSETGVELDLNDDDSADYGFAGISAMTVSLGPGDDLFDGAWVGASPIETNVTVCGAAGADDLRGGAGLDRLEGGAGDDTLRAATTPDGSDYFDGGDDVDTVRYEGRAAGIAISLDGQMNDGADGEEDNVIDIENLVGGSGNDALNGTSAVNFIDGGPGDDAIDGGAGDDVLIGGDGDDTFYGGDAVDGADLVNGGPGSDTVIYAERTASISVTVCASTQNDGCAADTCACEPINGEAGEADVLANVENAQGGSAADTFIGDSSNNSFFANGGNDVLHGNGGDDSLFGDDGEDEITGDDGDDYLDGAAGMDQFDAGAGTGDICVVEAVENAKNCELY